MRPSTIEIIHKPNFYREKSKYKLRKSKYKRLIPDTSESDNLEENINNPEPKILENMSDTERNNDESDIKNLARIMLGLQTEVRPLSGPQFIMDPFNGNEEKILDFFNEYNCKANAFGWNEKEKTTRLQAYLSGSALTKYQNLADDQKKNWKDFQKIFIEELVMDDVEEFNKR